MNRREALRAMLAGTALPVAAAMGSQYEPPGEPGEEGAYAVASLMAILLDLTDEEFHAKSKAQREMLMGALYEVLTQDDEAVKLWADSIGSVDKKPLADLHTLLKARAQGWEAALDH